MTARHTEMKVSPALLAVLLPSVVLAQATASPTEPTPSPPPAPRQAAELEEVGVTGDRDEGYQARSASTATRTDTPVMETPVAVQVVPQALMQDQQATSLDKAILNVSGVTPVTAGLMSSDDYIIRGFDNFALTFEDGLRHDEYTFSGFARDLANVERVEVIKGPASILYGQVEPGGLVNVVTKRPLEEARYSVEQKLGSYGVIRTAADLTGPLTSGKALLYRLNVAYEKSDSFRDFVQSERLFLYPTLEWRPATTDRLTLEFKFGNGSYVGDNGLPFLDSGTPAAVPISRNYTESWANHFPTTEFSAKVLGTHEFVNGWKARLAYHADYVSQPPRAAVFISGTADVNGDLARYYAPPGSEFWHWGHETVLDVSGNLEGFGLKHVLLAGASAYYMKGYYDYNGTCVLPDYSPCPGAEVPPINIYHPIYDQPYPPVDPTQYGYVTSYARAFGFYAQDQVEAPGHVHVLAGLRLDRATVQNSGYGPGSLGTVTDHPPIVPRLGVLWRPISELSAYASYTSNFGATALGTPTKSGEPLPPQSAQQYEAGVKSELLERRLTATAAVYQITKQHIPYTDPSDPLYSIAIGEARSRGFELDFRGDLGAGLSAVVAYAYTDARTTKDANADLVGKRFPNVPFHGGSLWATWAPPAGPLRGFRLGGGMVARSGEVNFSDQVIDGFAIVNAMAGYARRVGKMDVEVQLNVDNLLDRRYFASVNYDSATPGAPLSVVGSLRLSY